MKNKLEQKSYQNTINEEIGTEGIGLHTGLKSVITFKPAPENSGINFKRTDVKNCPLIPANIENVIDIARATVIAKDNNRIHTVEHVLSAVMGLGIDNIIIELTSKEPPIMDGSAEPFVKLLKKVGLKKQKSFKNEIVIDKVVSYKNEKKGIELHVLPSPSFRITFISDYNVNTIGAQSFTFDFSEDNFIEDIAPARTFCLFSEIMTLKELGLIKGGSTDNALVFIDKEIKNNELSKICKIFKTNSDIAIGKNGILNNTKLRFRNEPVRHKILDLIGDLALLGKQVKGHVIATKSGHEANVEFAKKIKKTFDNEIKSNTLSFDIHDILKIMPHRYPFLLIDKIIDLQPGKIVRAVKNITISEPFYNGHFPGEPIMPGVLILESIAQAGGFLLLNSIKKPQDKLVYFTAVKNARFKKAVIPGDQLKLVVKLLKFKLGTCKIDGSAYVGNELVTTTEIMATVVDRRK